MVSIGLSGIFNYRLGADSKLKQKSRKRASTYDVDHWVCYLVVSIWIGNEVREKHHVVVETKQNQFVKGTPELFGFLFVWTKVNDEHQISQ